LEGEVKMILKKRILGALLFLGNFSLQAQNYAVSLVPVELREKAHSVVRFYQTEFNVKDAGQATTKIMGAVTVLDEKGGAQAAIVIPYNKFTRVNDIEAQLFDAKGEKIKRLKRSEIESYSTSSGDNSIEDSFVKIALLRHTSYPYTVAFSYEYTTRNMMFYPTWEAILNNEEGTSVEKSRFVVSMPNGLKLRYLEQNMPAKATVTTQEERMVYTWEVNNLKAIEAEPYAAELSRLLPCVYTGPTEFAVDDYRGNLSSWADLGKFYGELNKERYTLPAQTVSMLKEKVKPLKTTPEKIRFIYEYLQGSTRYVSIQLGIGGWQSMKAEEVAAKGYGDCKALTTYMKAMLHEVGINSYLALVRAGGDESDILVDFPSFQFNHVFLCVPTEKDTVWLECTDQHNPYGYLGSFTEDRHVVLVTEEGGRLVKTPVYKASENQQRRTASVKINENAEGVVEMTTLYTGLQQEQHSGALHALNAEDQKRRLLQSITLPTVEIQKFSFKEEHALLPSVEEKVQLFARNVGNKSGTRMFITPNLLNQTRTVPSANPARKYDFQITSNYTDTDSICFEVPKGYTFEYLPEPVKIVSKFGQYEATVSLEGERIVYLRRMTMYKGNYAATEFNAWVDFRKKVVKADKNQLVLVVKP
jgi:hypothetical protein